MIITIYIITKSVPRVPFSLHPCQHLFPIILIIDSLAGMKWQLIVVLICSSLNYSDVEQFFHECEPSVCLRWKNMFCPYKSFCCWTVSVSFIFLLKLNLCMMYRYLLPVTRLPYFVIVFPSPPLSFPLSFLPSFLSFLPFFVSTLTYC